MFGIFQSICQPSALLTLCYSIYYKITDSDRCFQTFFMKQISEDDKENGRRCNENIHPRPFYIDREIFMSIAIPNIDKTKTLKEVGTSISHTIPISIRKLS